jgi:hypothetical protein
VLFHFVNSFKKTTQKKSDNFLSNEFQPATLSPRAASALNMDALLQEIEKKPVQVFDIIYKI